jgi:hypothetical protein
MATSISYFSSSCTPHSIEIILTGAGAGGAATIPRATLLGQCASGPLKEVLTRATDWTVFNLGSARCGEVHVRSIIDRAGGVNTGVVGVTIYWDADAINVECAETQQFEIRLQHSERF